MNDDSQYDLSNFRKKKQEDDSQYNLSNFRKKTNPNQRNETSIGEDIKQSFLNSPHALMESLKQFKEEIPGAYHMPLGRSLKNIGQGAINTATAPIGLGNTLIDYLVKKHVPYAEKLRNAYPQRPLQDVFGLGEHQPGDVLFQSAVPFGGIGKLTKGMSGLKGAAARAGGGSLYSTSQGGNPIESFLTGSALEGLTQGALSAPSGIRNLGERIKSGASNAILNRARKGLETGESFTPEQSTKNALQQYTNIEGQPMGIDFGTLVGNKPIQDLYNVGSKIPLTGGRQQIAKVDKQLFDKKEALAKLSHEKESGALNQQKKGYEQQLKQSIAELQKQRDILENQLPKLENEIAGTSRAHQEQSNFIEQAPANLSSLRHPQVKHNELFKNEIETGFNNAKEEAELAYQPFNELDIDLNSLKMPETFESQYKRAFDEFNKESKDLEELFSDDKDLGKDISKEIKKANSFFEFERKEPATGHKQPRIGTEPLFKLKKATPQAITTHIRNLQSLAEEAYAAGKHREAAMLKKMASGMKSDMKKILSENGYHEAVEALEAGDELFKSDVLPFYKNREVKKLASDRKHQLTDTSRISLSNALHQPNLEPILSKLSPEAQNASIYELITRGKYGPSGHSLTPKEIASSFNTHLKSNVRESIANLNPQMAHYLENLNPMLEENARVGKHIENLKTKKSELEKQTTTRINKAEREHEKATTGTKVTEERLEESNKKFQQAMKERFGIPKSKSKSIFASLKNFSPLNAAGLGTALYAMGKVSIPHIAEVMGLSVMPFKLANKILTEIEEGKPKLLKHYVEGTKVTPKIKSKSDLEKRIRAAFSVPKNVPVSGQDRKYKPLELEVVKKR